MQMLHFPCLPSYLFLLRLGVTLLYCLPFHWILYPFFIACLFCTESIRVRGRDLSNILFEETDSTIDQKFAKLKNSFFDEEDSISKDAKTSSLSINTSPKCCCQGFSSFADSSFNDSSSSSFVKSTWSSSLEAISINDPSSSSVVEESHACNELIASLERKEGHVYSMAISGDLLYTGSDSKNICVWNKHTEISGFKSHGGLVKTIVIAGGKIFTGHRDGLIRVWKCSSRNPSYHKRLGTLPSFKGYLINVIKPTGYFDVNGCQRDVWLKHSDAISCLSFNEDKTLLYSASWDKTFKVWKVSDWKCLESVQAHDDAVNSIVVGCNGLVFTGSADGTVKVWRREIGDKGTRHSLLQTLLNQDCAITALAVNRDGAFVYCGSSDGLVNFWECDDRLIYGGSLRGHNLAVLCLVTAGNLVISGSGDKTISIWKRCGNQHFFLSKLTDHNGPIKCLEIQKDCDESTTSSAENQWILYSGSLDKSVKIWRVSEQTPSRQNPSETDSSDSKCSSSSIELAL